MTQHSSSIVIVNLRQKLPTNLIVMTQGSRRLEVDAINELPKLVFFCSFLVPASQFLFLILWWVSSTTMSEFILGAFGYKNVPPPIALNRIQRRRFFSRSRHCCVPQVNAFTAALVPHQLRNFHACNSLHALFAFCYSSNIIGDHSCSALAEGEHPLPFRAERE